MADLDTYKRKIDQTRRQIDALHEKLLYYLEKLKKAKELDKKQKIKKNLPIS